VARFKTHEVHTGELFSVPPSGRTITMTGMEMYRLSGDKIAELWGEYNVSELFGQAG
jgi:predicted ester cyclase